MAVGPGSLVAPPAMLTPKMYHLQQPLNPPPSSPTSGKISRSSSKLARSKMEIVTITICSIQLRDSIPSDCLMSSEVK
ncbi:hypothetical protein HZH66_006615 [Vespula vulgaris]|uniref:Uncharacterized protein n=2 Tax=Vespula TaxID=7451 RepID=A0A834N8Y3_VESVU|nr:hypothetical protein HZH66_006615 [Vespula vulgaris]